MMFECNPYSNFDPITMGAISQGVGALSDTIGKFAGGNKAAINKKDAENQALLTAVMMQKQQALEKQKTERFTKIGIIAAIVIITVVALIYLLKPKK